MLYLPELRNDHDLPASTHYKADTNNNRQKHKVENSCRVASCSHYTKKGDVLVYPGINVLIDMQSQRSFFRSFFVCLPWGIPMILLLQRAFLASPGDFCPTKTVGLKKV